MQNLISLVFLIVGVAIFYIGYMTGKDIKHEPTENEGSFFMPSVPKVEDKPKNIQEKEDNANRFYK